MSLNKGILAGVVGILVAAIALIVAFSLRGEPGEPAAASTTEAVAPTEIPPLEMTAVESPNVILGVIGNTPTPAGNQAPAEPTALPSPTAAVSSSGSPSPQPTPTELPAAAALPCNQAAAGNPLDVTVPSGTQMDPGEVFVKTWQVLNTGSCTWTSQYSLVWASGEQMSSLNQVGWTAEIAPGGILEVSVEMTAPSTSGMHQSAWLLRSSSGETFGLGSNGNTPLLARIEVVAGAAPTPTQTPPTTTGSISGRVLLNGAPLAGVVLTLEDQYYSVYASVQSGADGSFLIQNLPVSAQGYNLVFTQEANPGYAIEQVASWSWIGPIPLSGGASVQLPDFELGYAGFAPLSPAPDSSYPAGSISSATPLVFEWSLYPGASEYWVDLVMGEEQSPVWQSGFGPGPTAAFDGVLFGGAFVQPGDYWWAVGARKPVGAYIQTVYTYLVGFTLES